LNKSHDKTLGSSIFSTWIAATRPAGTIHSVTGTLGLAMANSFKPPNVATSLMSTMKMPEVSAWWLPLRSGVFPGSLLNGPSSNDVLSALTKDASFDEAPLLSNPQNEPVEWFCSDPVLSFVYRVAVHWNEFKQEQLQVFLYKADRFVAKRIDAASAWAVTLCVPLNHFLQAGNSSGVIVVLFAFIILVEGSVKLRGYM